MPTATKFNPQRSTPWQPGGLTDTAATPPDPVKGPYCLEYRDAAGAIVRVYQADLVLDGMAVDGAIPWASVIRYVRCADMR